MRIGLIVADAPHLKTESVAIALSGREDLQVSIIALPFVQRKPRKVVFAHRPDQSKSVPLEELASVLGVGLVKLKSLNEIDGKEFDFFLLTGGILIPGDFVDQNFRKIINCHPGLIPKMRGLDSFKWAICNLQPLGNTLHFIDERIDMGFVLYREVTPVYPSDSLESLALRHYHNEVRILVDFQNYLDRPVPAETFGEPSEPTMRMPASVESELQSKFFAFREKFSGSC